MTGAVEETLRLRWVAPERARPLLSDHVGASRQLVRRSNASQPWSGQINQADGATDLDPRNRSRDELALGHHIDSPGDANAKYLNESPGVLLGSVEHPKLAKRVIEAVAPGRPEEEWIAVDVMDPNPRTGQND